MCENLFQSILPTNIFSPLVSSPSANYYIFKSDGEHGSTYSPSTDYLFNYNIPSTETDYDAKHLIPAWHT